VTADEAGRMAAILAHYGAEDVPEGYGDRWRPMHCPFHDDDHMSASYNEAADAFSCMACPAKGNAVTLLMNQERLTGREANALATKIAGHPGVSLHHAPSPRRKTGYVSPRLRRRLA
jgi:hypothetical protein